MFLNVFRENHAVADAVFLVAYAPAPRTAIDRYGHR